jgi:predicted PurR-regulated permease PerM
MEEYQMSKPAKRNRDPFMVVFYVFIGILMVFFVGITLKIAFSPVCSADAQHVCVIDTWSIAGLTAAIFGIAATLLAFLGAFAVAYWWANLDQKVDKQVEARTNELIEQRIKEQESKFQTQIVDSVKAFDARVEDNVKAFETRISQLEATFQTQITQLNGSFQFIRKELVIVGYLLMTWGTNSCTPPLPENTL